jgi:hypothetical protein
MACRTSSNSSLLGFAVSCLLSLAAVSNAALGMVDLLKSWVKYEVKVEFGIGRDVVQAGIDRELVEFKEFVFDG